MTAQDIYSTRRRAIRDLILNKLPPLIEVPLPESTRNADWFREANLEKITQIYAFPAYQIPLYSGKIFPAFQMLLADEKAGKHANRPDIAGSSSGNFIKDCAKLARRCFNVGKVFAIMNHGLSGGKVHHVEFAGSEVRYAPEGIPATDYVYQFAEENGCLVMDQYIREESITGHKVSMNHIGWEMHKQTQNAGYLFGAITGTGATCIAGKRYLPLHTAGRVQTFGVASMSKKEKVPGSRSPENLMELKTINGFGWQLYNEQERFLDFPLVTSVTQEEAFLTNAELLREHDIPAGPTSALLVAGTCHLIKDYTLKGEVDSLKNRDGKIVIVLFFMDSYLAYIDDPAYRSYFKQ